MSTPQINISSLDFQSIKNSLKTYLQTKSEFSGYDFNGTALNSLLDVFAYNTLYYSYYANMVANEAFLDTAKLERNIVSLVKPLGYVVPSKTSSKVEMTVSTKTGVASPFTFNAYTDFFSGISPNNVVYKYYSTKSITLTTGTSQNITLYEATSVVNNLPVSVETVNQKAFLASTNIDISTLTVKVNGEVWTRYNTYNPSSDPEGKVYFIDRLSNGFYLIFGKRTINDYQSSFGKNIEPTDVVTVSYLVPSGTVSNGVSSFSNSSLSVLSNTQSNNGTDGPDLDLVKFFAPKLLAANDRAITKDDYYGLLLSSNLLPSGINKKEQINIWGGDEADPASYGRVFISYADTNLTSTNPTVTKNVNFLKDKSIVTVIPEYIKSQIVNVTLNFNVRGIVSDQLSSIQTSINNIYNQNLAFNNNVNSTSIRDVLFETYPNITSFDIVSANVILDVFGSGSQKYLYFKNTLKRPAITVTTGAMGRIISSSIFNYNGTTISLSDFLPFPSATIGELVAINSAGLRITSIPKLGTVDYAKGIVYINSGVLPESTNIRVAGTVENSNNIIMKDEYIPSVSSVGKIV